MSCGGLGLLIDTSVFISWLNHRRPYNRLNDPIEDESFFLIVCTPLYLEYYTRLKKEYSGADYRYLDLRLRQLVSQIHHLNPIEESLAIINRKDQAHLDCAHNEEKPAHILVSDDTHFKEIKEKCPLPVILTTEEFLDNDMRSRACGDARLVYKKIKEIGRTKVFKQAKMTERKM